MLTADGIFACFIRQGYTNALAPWNTISPVSGSRRAGRTRGAELGINLWTAKERSWQCQAVTWPSPGCRWQCLCHLQPGSSSSCQLSPSPQVWLSHVVRGKAGAPRGLSGAGANLPAQRGVLGQSCCLWLLGGLAVSWGKGIIPACLLYLAWGGGTTNNTD